MKKVIRKSRYQDYSPLETELVLGAFPAAIESQFKVYIPANMVHIPIMDRAFEAIVRRINEGF